MAAATLRKRLGGNPIPPAFACEMSIRDLTATELFGAAQSIERSLCDCPGADDGQTVCARLVTHGADCAVPYCVRLRGPRG